MIPTSLSSSQHFQDAADAAFKRGLAHAAAGLMKMAEVSWKKADALYSAASLHRIREGRGI